MSVHTGADLLVDGLQRLGIDCVFGLPGTQVVPVFESLRRRGLRVVVPTHELAAGFMAMGYAKASARARPGVLITIHLHWIRLAAGDTAQTAASRIIDSFH